MLRRQGNVFKIAMFSLATRQIRNVKDAQCYDIKYLKRESITMNKTAIQENRIVFFFAIHAQRWQNLCIMTFYRNFRFRKHMFSQILNQLDKILSPKY